MGGVYKMAFESIRKAQDLTPIAPIVSRNSNSSKIIMDLKAVEQGNLVAIDDILTVIKGEQYCPKPTRQLLEQLGAPFLESPFKVFVNESEQQAVNNCLLEGFFKNISKTGSFCYYRKVLFYSQAGAPTFLIKGNQVNYISLVQGKYQDSQTLKDIRELNQARKQAHTQEEEEE